MAQIIRMPTVDELPEGPRREFVQELHGRYRDAKWPPLRKVDALLKNKDGLAATASKETIRRMLRGQAVPRNWDTVDAALIAFCELAGTSPEDHQPGTEELFGSMHGEPGPTHREELLARWMNAIVAPSDEVLSNDHQSSETSPHRNGFSDEPPF